jgi:hypothetical protein
MVLRPCARAGILIGQISHYSNGGDARMPQGTRIVQKSPEEVMDRLRMLMSAGNFEITDATGDAIWFRHGTYLTQSAPQYPKQGVVRVSPAQDGTEVSYWIESTAPVKVWLTLFGVVFFWLILPPIVAYRTMEHHPRQLMENLLQGL